MTLLIFTPSRVAKRTIKIRNEKGIKTGRTGHNGTCNGRGVNRQEWRQAGRMIVAYSRCDGAATSCEMACVTVALPHLRGGDDSRTRIDPVRRWLQTYGFQ